MNPYLLTAPILNPVSETEFEWYPDGALGVGGDGKIEYAGERGELPEQYSNYEIRATENIILPGFVDMHTHLPQYYRRGRFSDSLLDWLEDWIYPEEARFSESGYARSVAEHFYRAAARAGSTTLAVYSSSSAESTHISFQVAEKSGLRAIMGKVLMDQHAPPELLPSMGAQIAGDLKLIELWHRKTPLLHYAVSPRFAISCTPELLRAAGELAREHGTYIQTHINEQAAEIERVKELFPGSSSYSAVYDDAALLTDRTILGHNIHASESERALQAERACATAHCPGANLFLGSGRFPVEHYGTSSSRYGLGSDVGAGTSLSMLRVMRSMSHVQGRSLHPFLPLYRASLGGAEALGLAQETGSLAPGKSADFIELRFKDQLHESRTPADLSAEEAASLVVYVLPEDSVIRTVVAGEDVIVSAT